MSLGRHNPIFSSHSNVLLVIYSDRKRNYSTIHSQFFLSFRMFYMIKQNTLNHVRHELLFKNSFVHKLFHVHQKSRYKNLFARPNKIYPDYYYSCYPFCSFMSNYDVRKWTCVRYRTSILIDILLIIRGLFARHEFCILKNKFKS